MRVKRTALGFGLSTCLICTSAFADSHGRPVVATPHVQAQSATVRPTTTTKPAHGTTSGATSSSASTAKHGTKSGSTLASTSTTPKSTSVPLNPIAAKITSKPQLNSRISAMLPKGMTLNQASSGFKNQGQFIAALHVSQNLGCDCFKQIKADMTRKQMSLGQAIQDVKKTANPTVEVHRAETEADEDVKRPKTTTTTAATGTTGTHTKTSADGSDR